MRRAIHTYRQTASQPGSHRNINTYIHTCIHTHTAIQTGRTNQRQAHIHTWGDGGRQAGRAQAGIHTDTCRQAYTLAGTHHTYNVQAGIHTYIHTNHLQTHIDTH